MLFFLLEVGVAEAAKKWNDIVFVPIGAVLYLRHNEARRAENGKGTTEKERLLRHCNTTLI